MDKLLEELLIKQETPFGFLLSPPSISAPSPSPPLDSPEFETIKDQLLILLKFIYILLQNAFNKDIFNSVDVRIFLPLFFLISYFKVSFVQNA